MVPPFRDQLAREVVGRAESLFQGDVVRHATRIEGALAGRRVLAVGGAGSIGTATVLELVARGPAHIALLDSSENGLAELTRRLRSHPDLFDAPLEPVPLDYGSPLARRWLEEQRPFDLVLVFAALKHVRSERDAYSTARMLEVNLLAADRFLAALRRAGHGREGVFFVSTDKAVRPASVMGASKRAMEGLLWAHAAPGPASLLDGGDAPPLSRVSSARFANVLFSEGSITAAFLSRLALGQALSAPADVRRWFVTPEEAGQLCLLAALLAPHRHLLVPALATDATLDLTAVAERVLRAHGLEPARTSDPGQARAAPASELARGRWPLLVTRTDTPGEKESEELLAPGEELLSADLACARAVRGRELERDALCELLARIDRAARGEAPDLPGLMAALRTAVPELEHKEGAGGLDRKM